MGRFKYFNQRAKDYEYFCIILVNLGISFRHKSRKLRSWNDCRECCCVVLIFIMAQLNSHALSAINISRDNCYCAIYVYNSGVREVFFLPNIMMLGCVYVSWTTHVISVKWSVQERCIRGLSLLLELQFPTRKRIRPFLLNWEVERNAIR